MSNDDHIDHDFIVGETVYIRGEGTVAGGEVRGVFVGKDGRLNYVIEMPRAEPPRNNPFDHQSIGSVAAREAAHEAAHDPALMLAAIYYQTIMNANNGN